MTARFWSYGHVTVGTTAVAIRPARGSRMGLAIYNNGTATIFVGDASVTTSTGFPIPAGTSQSFGHTTALYGVAASGSQDVRFSEEAS